MHRRLIGNTGAVNALCLNQMLFQYLSKTSRMLFCGGLFDCIAYPEIPYSRNTSLKKKIWNGRIYALLNANSGKTEHLFRTNGTRIPFETEQD